MGIPLSVQLSAFVYSILTGALLGVLYDCFRVLRVLTGVSAYTNSTRKVYAYSLPLIGRIRRQRLSDKRRALRLVCLTVGDVLFAFLAGCVFSVFLYHAASGSFRWFYIFGCAVGFFLYYFTLGKIVMLSSETAAFLLIATFRYAMFFFLLPFRLLGRLASRLSQSFCRRVLRPLSAVLYRRRRLRYTRRVRASLAEQIRFTET